MDDTRTDRDPLDLELIRANITKLLAEGGKLQAEQEKLHREARYYPWIAVATFIAAAAAFAKLFPLLGV